MFYLLLIYLPGSGYECRDQNLKYGMATSTLGFNMELQLIQVIISFMLLVVAILNYLK